MKKLGPYAFVGRLALAVVLFVASSGFTVVLHSCLMENRACCEGMPSGGTMLPGSERVSRAASACCENTIVGGLNRSTATIEQQAPLHLKTIATAQAVEPVAGQSADEPRFIFFSRSRPPDPPPFGLYISNLSLLI